MVKDRSTGATITWATVAVDSGNADQYIITAAPSSPGSELQTTHAVKLEISPHADYSGLQGVVSVDFDIVVATPTCDCNQQPWDDGTTATLDVATPISGDPGTAYTMQHPTRPANYQTYNPVMTVCADSC